jgi:hypothetical protein
MREHIQAVNPYLLVDGALAGEAISRMAVDLIVGTWLHPVYVGEGKLVGPLVIDIDAAVQAQQVDDLMFLVNAMSPQLHLSYIATLLSAVELTSHLRQFSVIRTSDGRLCNLRLSDCVVLSMLTAVFSSEQWATLTGPLSRWSMHCRSGATLELQCVFSESPVRVPLTLSESQLVRLAELGAPDVMLANIRAIRHGEPLSGRADEQHRWASAARQKWIETKSGDELVLRWITAAAVDTKGAFLLRSGLPSLLVEGNRDRIKAEIASATGN